MYKRQTLGYDLIITQIISSSLSLGYTDSDAVVDAGNDAETYDIGLVLNFAFPWALYLLVTLIVLMIIK